MSADDFNYGKVFLTYAQVKRENPGLDYSDLERAGINLRGRKKEISREEFWQLIDIFSNTEVLLEEND